LFRSKRRDVVYPQAEHARMAGAIAVAFHPEEVPLPFESWVRGVTLHDRGYGELDQDPIGETSQERWAGEIETGGFRAESGDAVADLVVALHIRRLIGDDVEHPARAALAREIDERLGDVPPEARAADRLTELCDSIAFTFCFELADERTAAGITFVYDGAARITLDPWPFAIPQVRGVVQGFAGDGYPARLEPIVSLFELCT
jgi:hypothetical protein